MLSTYLSSNVQNLKKGHNYTITSGASFTFTIENHQWFHFVGQL